MYTAYVICHGVTQVSLDHHIASFLYSLGGWVDPRTVPDLLISRKIQMLRPV